MLRLDMDSGSVMLGINNRDLQTFKVDLQNNQRIMDSPAGQEVGHSPSLMVRSSITALGQGLGWRIMHLYRPHI